MDPFADIVEQKLAQAERDGAFANLPGSGRPLQLEDLDNVPPELRASWILLRTNGLVPPELEARKEWLRLCDLVAACHEDERPAMEGKARQAWLRFCLFAEQRAPAASGLFDDQDELRRRLEH